MAFENICPPALIYIIFSLIQIIIDAYNGLYNTALLKSCVAIIFTTLLNYLCDIGLGVISWFIVFIPFILMTVIISVLLLVFGLDPTTGKSNVYINNKHASPKKPVDHRAESIKKSKTTIQTHDDDKKGDAKPEASATTSKNKSSFFDNYNDSLVNTIESI